MGMALDSGKYIDNHGRLRLFDLLIAFSQFFREHSESWLDSAQYKEAGPQHLLQAFLQRIVNGGGQIHREYGLGMGRSNLFILWNLPDGNVQRFVIECKIQYGTREVTISKGIDQVLTYADRCNADEVYLIIFDRSTEKKWEQKIFVKNHEQNGGLVTVFGM